MFVVKKNKSVLENLCQWLNDRAGDAAALVIDDEADNASVNTGALPEDGRRPAGARPDHHQPADPQASAEVQEAGLRGLHRHAVRQHLHPLPGRAFGLWRRPLPSAFILNLHTPSNHVGPAEVFGLPEDRRVGLEEREGLPVVRTGRRG